MSLKGKRIAILAEDMYDELELWYPYYRLVEEGAEVKIIGP
jgi:protease I